TIGERPLERSTQVGVLALEAVEPHLRVLAADAPQRAAGKLGEVARMPRAGILSLPASRELLDTVVAQRLEHAEMWLFSRLRAHQTLIDQRPQHVEHIVSAIHQGLSGLDREAADEDGQPT